MLSLPRRKYPAMIDTHDPDPVEELLGMLDRLHSQPSDEIVLTLLRLLAEIPGSALRDLAPRLPERFAWLLLYHPNTERQDVVRALQSLPYHDVRARHVITALVVPEMLEELPASIRPVVVGRLMLGVLNHQLALAALPIESRLYDYLDEFPSVPGARRSHVDLWEALYALVHAITLWRRSGFHPRQWECQTVISSLPSEKGDALLHYAHDIWCWAEGDAQREAFAGQFWGLTLKYLGAGESPHLSLADLCRVMETAHDLRPPFLASVEPDPNTLCYVTVEDFDHIFRTIML